MSTLEQHPQWPAVKKIYHRLTSSGYKALIAGGAVRDLFLSREPNDIDIATNATPEQVEQLFDHTVMVGKAFGVSRVIIGEHDIEVATFRKDGPYKDGRKPEYVQFCDEKEDANRRDFTINAMFYHLEKKEIIDFVGGQKDLMVKILRTVGDPKQRFAEDKLRLLRVVRFHAQLDFVIEEKTADAVRQQSETIDVVSMERVRDEFGKILTSEFVLNGLQKLYDLNLWQPLFKKWRFQPLEYKKFFEPAHVDADKAWTIWFLLHSYDSIESMAQEGMRWKLPKKLIQKIVYCRKSLPQLKNIEKVPAEDFAIFLSRPNSRFAIEVFQHYYADQLTPVWFDKLKAAQSFFSDGNLPELLVTGDDLIQYGFQPGPEIAEQLKKLYRIQLKKKVKNKEELLSHLAKGF